MNSEQYRQGYSDALDLFDSLGSNSEALKMVEHAVPPAMPADYQTGFRTFVNVMRNHGLKG